jgi:CBS domain-containing protein
MIREKGRLVVMEEGRAVGIITAADLIKRLPAVESELKVEDAMTPKVAMVSEDTSVEVVAGIMGQKRIGSVIVTRGENSVGIFTERDLLSKIIAGKASFKIGVGEVASSPLVAIPSGTSIHEVARLMAEKRIRRLPVVGADGKIVGIVTARDLVEAYAK